MSVYIHKFPLGLTLPNLIQHQFLHSNAQIQPHYSPHPKAIMTKPTEKPSKLNRFLRSPIRALVRLRDSYIRGVTGSADRCQSGGVSFGHLHPLPSTQGVARSNRFGSSARTSSRGDDELLQQLIRAMEMRRVRSLELGREEAVNRSRRGLKMERIDEDLTCEFDGDVGFERSRSFAVGGKREAAHAYA
ncbi:uncharacterized protein A4U43_C03F7970 [Asparagus officinalis]|uniref:Uncharacterized protein n=1 Tax=Asparagus officinalis TaxID=4686 RepID=A0A5P1F8T5_ASPOF|nr:uncharacterized protein LOC109832113 [Asparagus officinalis]ONK74582.1 uncharacterized protein A4U43_C03F7970 [Asparagus officinalis]